MTVRLTTALLVALLMASAALGDDTPHKFASHAPVRPLPEPAKRPRTSGPQKFIDATKGDDKADGSEGKPWKSLAHAVSKVAPGDTLHLRGGIYFEAVSMKGVKGTAKQPITVRSFPGELAVLDGGLREFFENPAEAWEPFSDGAEGEFRSKRAYPGLAEREARRGVHVIGNFGDSLVPLHGYRTSEAFRSSNESWHEGTDKLEQAVYVGPGLWYDNQTGRIHTRLAHLKSAAYGVDRYQGETDPRRLPLIVAGRDAPLSLADSSGIRLEDLVVRGALRTTLQITNCQDVVLDNVTVYGGSPAVSIEGTRRLTLIHSAVRGLSAPWSSRASHKYLGNSPYLLICGGGNREFELAHCEFTDNHDGLQIGRVLGMKFHHNLVENFDDDGVYLNSHGEGGEIQIHQNWFSRILSTFAFSGNLPTGRGVYIFRNVFDMRRPACGGPPNTTGETGLFLRPSRIWGDHGSPTWEPMYLYHNTVVLPEREWRDYYAGGWGGHTQRTKRRIFNNLFVHVEGLPGLHFDSADDDLEANGNLHWGLAYGPKYSGDFFATLRKSPLFAASQRKYPPGWAANDLFADPRLVKLLPHWKEPLDPRLQTGSPAIDAGVELPKEWPDPIRSADVGKPDIGAVPSGESVDGLFKSIRTEAKAK